MVAVSRSVDWRAGMARREGWIRRFFGPPGSDRRRRLRGLPVLGPVLGAVLRVYRAVRDRRIETGLALQRARTDFKNRRARTVPNIARRNNRRAYERIYGEDSLLSEYLAPERIAFYEEVAEISVRERPRAVIDVGCGAGHLLRSVIEKASPEPERVVGIDYTSAGIERARELVPSGEFRTESLYDLDSVETFDLVLCTEVLEHLRDPKKAVEVLVRLCARAGAIVITVPDGAQDSWQGHRNFWTKSELEHFLSHYGRVEISRLGKGEVLLLAVVRP
jgi:SAM-dependent methyltransferase